MPEDRWGFDRWAMSYDEDITKAAKSDDWMFKDYDRILDTVVDYCDLTSNEYSTVVDIGTGTGNLAARFAARGLQVIGIEPSEEMRRICQQKYPDITIKVGDFLSIPLPSNSVDLIVSAYAFHHLTPTQKEKSILEMKRVLKSKGRVVIADLMFQNLSQEQLLKQSLHKSSRSDIVEEIEDEYLGFFDDLNKSFNRVGFTCHGERLTAPVWILCACI